MPTSPLDNDETNRLARLRELFILDSEPEPAFDAIALMASQVCGAPMAMITLVDADRQWFKAAVGTNGITETPRAVAFCAHTILSDDVLVIPDTALDARFADLPLVTAGPKVRFYAGAPLVLPGGERIGSLCVTGPSPAGLNDQQVQMLRSLADVVTKTVVMRGDLITKTLAVRSRYERGLAEKMESQARAVALEAENRHLAEVGRQRSVFLSNMSHEFRTPLNAVLGCAHLLEAGTVPPDSPKFRHYLGQIGTSGRQLLGLIDTVLNFSEVESGALVLRPEPVRLKPALQAVMESLRADSLKKGMYLSLEVDPKLEDVVTDKLRLAQVVSHLVSNAIKFSDDGGSVTLRAWTEGDAGFRIEVEDSGIGIAEADLPRLFTPFQQLSEGATKAYAGVGLGLALSRRLVEAQGGEVGVYSFVGVGSVFWLVLPRTAPAQTPAGPVGPASPAVRTGTAIAPRALSAHR